MELLKYINNELRVKSLKDVFNSINNRVLFYSIDYISNATNDMKIIGNVVMARDPIFNSQKLYVYNGLNFDEISSS